MIFEAMKLNPTAFEYTHLSLKSGYCHMENALRLCSESLQNDIELIGFQRRDF
eukprot:gene8044-12506_t